MGYVYALKCPVTKSLRYVGQTIYHPKERLYAHLSVSRKPKNNLHHWINGLLKQSLRPELIILYDGLNKHLSFMESYYYTLLKDHSDLLNNDDLTDYHIDRKSLQSIYRNKNLKCKEVAKASGVHYHTVNKFFTTDWPVKPDKALKIHDYLVTI